MPVALAACRFDLHSGQSQTILMLSFTGIHNTPAEGAEALLRPHARQGVPLQPMAPDAGDSEQIGVQPLLARIDLPVDLLERITLTILTQADKIIAAAAAAGIRLLVNITVVILISFQWHC